jgi:hypothetical protein
VQGEKMNFDFGEVLTRMWKIGWNHKVLWLWQMLPGLVYMLFMPLMFLMNPAIMATLPEPYNRFTNETAFFGIFVLLMFAMMLVPVILKAIANLVTIHGALKVELGAEKLTFRDLFNESLPYFWRVLGLYAIFVGAWMVLYFVFMFFFMAGSIFTFGLSTFLLFPMFLVVLPVLAVGYSVLELAQASIIAGNMGVFRAISHGWELFRKNWLTVSLLMVILYFGMTMISSTLMFPMMIPMMGFPFLMDMQGAVSNSMVGAFFALFLLTMILGLVVQGILMAFFQSAWAVTFLRLTRGENVPVQAWPVGRNPPRGV